MGIPLCAPTAKLRGVKKLKGVPMWILIAVVAVVVLCCGGALVSAFGDDKPTKTAKPAVVVPTLPTYTTPSLSASPTPSPVAVKMPNLVGQNAAVAQDTLKRAGFTNIQLGSGDAEDKLVILPQNWKVTEQSTPADQTVQSNTLIVLTCTKKR